MWRPPEGFPSLPHYSIVAGPETAAVEERVAWSVHYDHEEVFDNLRGGHDADQCRREWLIALGGSHVARRLADRPEIVTRASRRTALRKVVDREQRRLQRDLMSVREHLLRLGRLTGHEDCAVSQNLALQLVDERHSRRRPLPGIEELQ